MSLERSYLEERRRFYMQGLQQAEMEFNRWRAQMDAQRGAIAAVDEFLRKLDEDEGVLGAIDIPVVEDNSDL